MQFLRALQFLSHNRRNISFNVIIINEGDVPKKLRKHVNAQRKEYNCNPTEAFWKADNDLEIGPYESKSSATYTEQQKLLKMSLKCSLLITRNLNLQMFLKISSFSGRISIRNLFLFWMLRNVRSIKSLPSSTAKLIAPI